MGSVRAARLVPFAALAVIGTTALAGCGGDTAAAPAPSRSAVASATPHVWHGQVPERRPARPRFTLRDTSGEAFDFAARTSGRVTYLFFGYANCPDACPTAMADLAVALQDMPASVRSAVDVVFVTTDPKRDTPTALRAWLDTYDPTFIGLTGTPAEVAAAQTAAGLPVATTSSPKPHGHEPGAAPHSHGETGDYAVDHSSALTTYGRDDRVALFYPAGSVPDDYAADLPALVEEDVPS